MTLYAGGLNLTGKTLRVGSATVDRLYAGSTLAWQRTAAPPRATLVGIVSGDSTLAANYPTGLGIQSVASFASAWLPSPTDISVPNETIEQQRAHFEALSPAVKAAAELVLVQGGLNNVAANQATVAMREALQAYIDVIRASTSPGCLIYVSKMLPCKQRWIDLFGTTTGAVRQQRWAELNDAIAGLGSNPIVRVDGRIISHVPLLDDGAGNLANISIPPVPTGQGTGFNTGDNIHEYNNGRQIIASAWQSKLVADGVLTA